MNPRVSVIIPTHNRRARLEKAVDSVLRQTCRSFELVVVDDGSTDGTRELFSPPPAQTSYLFQENRGVAAARNAGIRSSRGQWLAFLDSDDEWLPEKLERQLRFHEKHPAVQISQTEEIWIRNGRRVNAMKKHKKPSGWIFEACLPLCLVSPSCVMVAREVLDKIGLFDENFPVCEDYEFWLRSSLLYEIGLVPSFLVRKHGGHADQLSRRYWGMDRFRIQAIEKTLLNPALTPGRRNACLRELETKCRIYAAGCHKRGKMEEAQEFLRKPAAYGFIAPEYQEARLDSKFIEPCLA